MRPGKTLTPQRNPKKMLTLCKGWNKAPISLIKTRRYYDVEVARKVQAVYNPVSPLVSTPIWLSFCSDYIRLEGKEEILLACKLICLQHNEGLSDSEPDTPDTSEATELSDTDEDEDEPVIVE